MFVCASAQSLIKISRQVQSKTRASSRTGENTYDLPRDTILHRSSGSSSRTSTVGHKNVSQRESFMAFNFRSCLFIVLNEMEVRRARLPGNGTRCTRAFCSRVTTKKIKPVCRYKFYTFACVNEDCSLLEGEEGGGGDPIKPSVMTVCFFFSSLQPLKDERPYCKLSDLTS